MQDDLKEKDEFILFFKIVIGKELKKFCPPNSSSFAFSSVFMLVLLYTVYCKAF